MWGSTSMFFQVSFCDAHDEAFNLIVGDDVEDES